MGTKQRQPGATLAGRLAVSPEAFAIGSILPVSKPKVATTAAIVVLGDALYLSMRAPELGLMRDS